MLCTQLVKRRLRRYSHAQLLDLFAPLSNAKLSSTTWSQGLGEASHLRSWRWYICSLFFPPSMLLLSHFFSVNLLVCFNGTYNNLLLFVYLMRSMSYFCVNFRFSCLLCKVGVFFCIMAGLLMFSLELFPSMSVLFQLWWYRLVSSVIILSII